MTGMYNGALLKRQPSTLMTDFSSRRDFLAAAARAGAAATLGATLLNLSACGSAGKPRPRLGLVGDPAGICDLPPGFSYTVISPHGATMDDGLTVPDYHDGMGCFTAPNGQLVLVRNHEIPLYFSTNPQSPVPNMAYDPKSSGGTTTVWLNDKLEVTRHYLSLTGTIRNCGGGKTPWGTWISCEEAGSEGWKMGERHAYNFEVDPLQPLRKTLPLKAMGRFNHEAIAVDASSGIVYQTEDDTGGCFYRFIPNLPGKLDAGGRLQALRVNDGAITHTTRDGLEVAKPYACDWVDVPDPDPRKNTVRLQARENGAAIFVRGEGVVAHADGVYFACTQGGAANIGQIFKYVTSADQKSGLLEVVYEATMPGVLEKPDNLTLNAWGDLIICEDNGLDVQCLAGLTPAGKLYYIASNTQSEWCGACFSPDGETLFANIHRGTGMTVGIRGPWAALRN